jgi:hypothetical protein
MPHAPDRAAQLEGTVRFSRPGLLIGAIVLAGCGGAQPSSVGGPASRAPTAIASAIAVLTDEVKTWCVAHTGGTGADGHEVEDMALTLGVVTGAKTREDVFGRWAGKSQPDLVQDPTYVAACVAAYAANANVPPSAASSAGASAAAAASGGTTFPVGDIPAGTWRADLFSPPFELTLPAGWTRGTADREVLVLRNGDTTVGISHRLASAAHLGAKATTTTIGPLAASTLRQEDSPGTLWMTEGLVAYDAPAGSSVQTWVVSVDSKSITIDLVAPKGKLDAALAGVLPILATFRSGS